MKFLLPKEHGAWAMWIAPYLIGILLTEFKTEHIIMLIAVFFAYITMYPFLQGLRRPGIRKEMWRFSFVYLVVALIFGLPILFLYPKIIFIVFLIVPPFLVNLYFLKHNNERAFINNLAALIPLNSTVLISYYIGTHQYDSMALTLFLLVFLFFLSSVFYVKVLIRERENKTFITIAKLYMLVLPLIGLWLSGIYLMLAYLFSTVIVFFPHSDNKISAKKIGLTEIFNTVWFIIFITLAYLPK